jgi:hypothetical protein
VSDVRESKDPAFRGKGGADFDSFVRNIYKVLLTRGMRGTVICSTDRETQAELASRGLAARCSSGPTDGRDCCRLLGRHRDS